MASVPVEESIEAMKSNIAEEIVAIESDRLTHS